MSRLPIAGKVLKWAYHHRKWARQIENIPHLYDTLTHFNTIGKVPEYPDRIVDIIVPVYNAYDFLEPLFKSLFNQSDVSFRLIIFDDASTDERVWPLLKIIESEHECVTLHQNSENLGFVKTVNQGLLISQHDVVILNSDVEVPEKWLSRLMYPIFEMKTVASATPMSNSSSITSFPELMQNNDLFKGKSLAFIDEEFRKLSCTKPIYVETPTGHGFCMAMSREAIEQIGMFDEEAFGKGCGEENDWCMRAQRAGFKNVIVPNLYCLHKHTASFSRKEKDRLTQKHVAIVKKRYPSYSGQVRMTVANEYYQSMRLIIQALLHNKVAIRTVVSFTNNLSGGSTFANMDFITQQKLTGSFVINIRSAFRREKYQLEFHSRTYLASLIFDSIEDIRRILLLFRIDEVVIHQLYGYSKLEQLLVMLASVRDQKGFLLKMDVRDFFIACPTIQLLDWKKQFCHGCIDMNFCNDCMDQQGDLEPSFKNISQWRQMWIDFLTHLDEIHVYSDFTKTIVLKIFGDHVVPEKIHVGRIPIDYIRPVHARPKKKAEPIHIAVIGNILVHKGLVLLNEMASIIRRENKVPSIKLFVVGKMDIRYNHSHFNQIGEYKREQLPDIIEKNEIDIIFIPSIWGETYCRTAEEGMLMQLPVACFDLGAPAERVRRYEKGLVVSKINAEHALGEMVRYVIAMRGSCEEGVLQNCQVKIGNSIDD